jgi:hypothetical protein
MRDSEIYNCIVHTRPLELFSAQMTEAEDPGPRKWTLALVHRTDTTAEESSIDFETLIFPLRMYYSPLDSKYNIQHR